MGVAEVHHVIMGCEIFGISPSRDRRGFTKPLGEKRPGLVSIHSEILPEWRALEGRGAAETETVAEWWLEYVKPTKTPC